MKLETVRANLVNTIAGKEKALAAQHPANPYSTMFMDDGEIMARRVMIDFLDVNIAELKRILADVEQCMKEVT